VSRGICRTLFSCACKIPALRVHPDIQACSAVCNALFHVDETWSESAVLQTVGLSVDLITIVSTDRLEQTLVVTFVIFVYLFGLSLIWPVKTVSRNDLAAVHMR